MLSVQFTDTREESGGRGEQNGGGEREGTREGVGLVTSFRRGRGG